MHMHIQTHVCTSKNTFSSEGWFMHSQHFMILYPISFSHTHTWSLMWNWVSTCIQEIMTLIQLPLVDSLQWQRIIVTWHTEHIHASYTHSLSLRFTCSFSLSGCGILFDSLVRAAWFRFMTILQSLPKHVSQHNFTMLHVTRSRIADYNALYLHQTQIFSFQTQIYRTCCVFTQYQIKLSDYMCENVKGNSRAEKKETVWERICWEKTKTEAKRNNRREKITKNKKHFISLSTVASESMYSCSSILSLF